MRLNVSAPADAKLVRADERIGRAGSPVEVDLVIDFGVHQSTPVAVIIVAAGQPIGRAEVHGRGCGRSRGRRGGAVTAHAIRARHEVVGLDHFLLLLGAPPFECDPRGVCSLVIFQFNPIPCPRVKVDGRRIEVTARINSAILPSFNDLHPVNLQPRPVVGFDVESVVSGESRLHPSGPAHRDVVIRDGLERQAQNPVEIHKRIDARGFQDVLDSYVFHTLDEVRALVEQQIDESNTIRLLPNLDPFDSRQNHLS